MEALAIAAGVALVKPMIQKVSSKQWEKLSMSWRLDREVDKMKQMLIDINLILEDPAKKSISGAPSSNWLCDFQDLAYDISDLLEVLEIEEQRRSKGQLLATVRYFFSSDNQIGFRRKVVKKIKKINKRLQQRRGELQPIQGNIRKEERETQIQTHSFHDQTQMQTLSFDKGFVVYGRQEEKKKIIDLLINDNNEETLSVLPLVGMGGVGKTTLAHMVCTETDIKKHFHPIVWVNVSGSFEDILNKRVTVVSEKGCEVPGNTAQNNELKTIIYGNKFLLVLDDVWNEDPAQWRVLMTVLRCGMKGNKILVTTRSEMVAKIVGKIL